MSGRGASYPAPPPQIPPCGFPAVGSCRRSNAIEGRSLAAHVPPTRRLAASVTRRPGSESGACVAARLSFDRPPSLHSLRCRFVVGFVRGFIGTTQPSDSSRLPQQLRLLDFLSWPGIALATAGGVRSPRFRRDPFIRDVASDPGRATVPRVTAPHMLPSAVATASAPATSRISWLNPTPQMITVYASPWSSPSPTQHSLPGGRYPLPGPDFHRLDRASFAWRTACTSIGATIMVNILVSEANACQWGNQGLPRTRSRPANEAGTKVRHSFPRYGPWRCTSCGRLRSPDTIRSGGRYPSCRPNRSPRRA